MSNLLFIGVMVAAFWFLVIRPQQVRQRKHAEMVDAMQVGDEIVTIGGVYATVAALGDRIRVRVADGSELEIAPMAVGKVMAAEDADLDDDSESKALDYADDAVVGSSTKSE